MSRPRCTPIQPLLTFPLIMLGGALSLFLWEVRVEQTGLAAARTVNRPESALINPRDPITQHLPD